MHVHNHIYVTWAWDWRPGWDGRTAERPGGRAGAHARNFYVFMYMHGGIYRCMLNSALEINLYFIGVALIRCISMTATDVYLGHKCPCHDLAKNHNMPKLVQESVTNFCAQVISVAILVSAWVCE